MDKRIEDNIENKLTSHIEQLTHNIDRKMEGNNEELNKQLWALLIEHNVSNQAQCDTKRIPSTLLGSRKIPSN